MSDALADFSKVLIALFTLAIIAVLAGNKQTATFVGDLGKFLVAMVQKVNGTVTSSTSTPVTTPLPTAGAMTAPGLGGIGMA